MIGVRWAMRLVGLVSTIILARLLAPEDFGLIAMVMLLKSRSSTVWVSSAALANSKWPRCCFWTARLGILSGE